MRSRRNVIYGKGETARDLYWMDCCVTSGRDFMDSTGSMPFATIIVNRHEQIVGLGLGTGDDRHIHRHSEMVAIKQATLAVGGLLTGCVMYQTHQPCHMCCGAIKHAKIQKVVWGSSRRDFPELFRPYRISSEELLMDTTNPPTVWVGVRKNRCLDLMRDYIALAMSTDNAQTATQ